MTLIALRPVLYLARQYRAGDELPTNNPVMTEAWIAAGSAAWKDEDEQAEATASVKARAAAAKPGIEGRTDKGVETQGEIPETPEREKPRRRKKST